MPSISECLPNGQATTEFGNGVTITTTFSEQFLTPAIEDQLMKLEDMFEKSDTPNMEIMKLYAGIIVDWDLTDEAGNKVATDAETLYSLPKVITRRVVESIRQVQQGNRPSDEPSVAG